MGPCSTRSSRAYLRGRGSLATAPGPRDARGARRRRRLHPHHRPATHSVAAPPRRPDHGVGHSLARPGLVHRPATRHEGSGRGVLAPHGARPRCACPRPGRPAGATPARRGRPAHLRPAAPVRHRTPTRREPHRRRTLRPPDAPGTVAGPRHHSRGPGCGSGVGPWTQSCLSTFTWGSADTVITGDAVIPSMVTWLLAGERRGDDHRMHQLLEPYRPHRYRVIRLAFASGSKPPAELPAPPPTPSAGTSTPTGPLARAGSHSTAITQGASSHPRAACLSGQEPRRDGARAFCSRPRGQRRMSPRTVPGTVLLAQTDDEVIEDCAVLTTGGGVPKRKLEPFAEEAAATSWWGWPG